MSEFDWANYDWGQGTPGLMARPKNDAMSMGLLAAGLGILANNRGNYGQLAPALGAGGLAGLSTMQNMMAQDRQSRLDESRLTMEQQRQKLMETQMAQGAQTIKMQQEQARRQQEQDDRQRALEARIGGMIDGVLTPPRSVPYQDQMTNQNVGGYNAELPKLNWQGSPDEYFKFVSSVKDPKEKQAMAEAGFRQWPDLRPQMQQGGVSNPALQMGAIGAMAGVGGVKGADSILKFAGMLKPEQLQGGSFYQGPNGQREYIPKVGENMRLNPDGTASAIPGAANAVGQIEGAKQTAQERARAALDLVPTFNPETRQMELKPRLGIVDGIGGAGAVSAPDPLRTKAAEGLNDHWIKNTLPDVTAKGQSASSMLANLDTLANINLKTGWGTEAASTAANVLAGLGIAPKNAQMFATNAQVFQGKVMERLWQTLGEQKGPQTEGDANRAKDTWVQLKNTPQANEYMMDFSRAVANRDKKRAEFYQEALPIARDSGDLTAIDRKWQQIQGSVWDDPVMKRWKK